MSAPQLPWLGRRQLLRSLAGVSLAVGYVPLVGALSGRGPREPAVQAGSLPGSLIGADDGDGSTLAAAASTAILSLVAGSPLDPAFLAGVREAAGAAAGKVAGEASKPGQPSGAKQGATQTYGLSSLDAGRFQHLEALLRDGQETRLVGLLDDARATLVLDLVRSAGGRVLFEARHRVGSDAAALAWASASGLALALQQDAPAAPVVFNDGVVHAHVSLCCLI